VSGYKYLGGNSTPRQQDRFQLMPNRASVVARFTVDIIDSEQ